MMRSGRADRERGSLSPFSRGDRASRSGLALIADDDETTRLVLYHALTRLGYVALPVDDGGEIFPVLEREDVSALILDLNMPGMNGWEVLRRIRGDFRYESKRQRLRIVIVSGQSDPASRDFVLSLGADAFLAKPLDLDELSRALGHRSLR
jgi:CheY-like chemotaxis protein